LLDARDMVFGFHFRGCLRACECAAVFAGATVFALGARAALPEVAASEPPHVRVAGVELPSLGFNLLAGYPFRIVDIGTGATAADIELAKRNDQVPATVRVYDGRRVVLTGFLLPLQVEGGGLTKKFILMKCNRPQWGRKKRRN
jgi:hypothetical protein